MQYNFVLSRDGVQCSGSSCCFFMLMLMLLLVLLLQAGRNSLQLLRKKLPMVEFGARHAATEELPSGDAG